jgi:transcriptional regulator with XRE-family HTH domain
MNDFVAWLRNELNIRGWRQADLARQSGMNTGLLSQILNGQRRAGVSTCRTIARALNMREVDVLHRAGLLTSAAVCDEDSPLVQEMIVEFIRLDDSDQEQILKQVRALNVVNARRSTRKTRSRP